MFNLTSVEIVCLSCNFSVVDIYDKLYIWLRQRDVMSHTQARNFTVKVIEDQIPVNQCGIIFSVGYLNLI